MHRHTKWAGRGQGPFGILNDRSGQIAQLGSGGKIGGYEIGISAMTLSGARRGGLFPAAPRLLRLAGLAQATYCGCAFQR